MMCDRFPMFRVMLLGILLVISWSGISEAQPTLMWDIQQQQQLGGELYQTAIAFDGSVLGVTRDQVVNISLEGAITTPLDMFPGQRANVSPDGQFIGLITESLEYEFDVVIESFDLRTSDGQSVATIQPTGTFVSFLIGAGAQMIVGLEVGDSGDALIPLYNYHLYDSTGAETGKANATDPTGIKIAPDGTAFAFNEQEGGLHVVDQKGAPLWNAPGPYHFFDISNGGTRAIANKATDISQVMLLEGGDPVGTGDKLPGGVFNVAISPDGGWMLATDVNTIRSYSGLMQKAWEYSLPDPSQVVTSAAITDTGFIACGLLGSSEPTNTTTVTDGIPDQEYDKGSVLLFGPDGTLLWQTDYSLGLTNAWIPTVAFGATTAGEMLLTVRTRENLQLYKVAL